MKNLVFGVMGFLTTILLASSPAAAWFHAGGGSWSASGFRGTASGGDGSWSASGYRGGSASGGDGSWSGTGFRGTTASGDDGSWGVNGYRGGSASGGDGSWSGTTPYGTSVYGYHGTYYGGTYATYHPPTVVNSYYGAGCYNGIVVTFLYNCWGRGVGGVGCRVWGLGCRVWGVRRKKLTPVF